jgi:DNA polymerase III subunit beta
MEIKIAKNDLLKGLGLVQSIVERKTTMPILANVLLTAEKKSLSITATDLEVGLHWSCSPEVLSEGKVTVHARSLYDIARELPEETVHLKVKEGNWIEIVCGKSRFKIVGLASEEFPALPTKGAGQTRRVDAQILREMIEKTSFAMSSDETRYNLNGVFTDFSGGQDGKTLLMVATDGHRLSIAKRDAGEGWEFPKGGIVPRKGITELGKLVDGGDAPLDLWIDAKHFIAYRENVTLVIRLIDGQFPPYEQVLPKKTKRAVALSRMELVHALKRVSVLSTDRARGVKFSISPNNFDIHASNPDLGEAHEELAANYKGDAFEIGFNARYFIEALSAIADEQAVLELGDETAPCVIKSEFDRGFTHVIMPMRL